MTYILAEIGNNHGGDVECARALIREAALAGADGVKFQIYRAERLVRPDLPAMVGEGTQLERMKRFELADDEWLSLRDMAERCGVDFVASVFDEELIQKWAPHLDAIKIASGDITHISLIRAANETGKPLILSAGLGTQLEVKRALHGLARDRVTLLHCVSEYPCPQERAALGRMAALETLHWRVGYSDHCCGIDACVVAVAMGAVMIEKHFTDAGRGGGEPAGDHVHAATPQELAELVSKIRQVEVLRDACYTLPSNNRRTLMRGAYAARTLRAGEQMGEDAIIALRPRTRRWPWDLRGARAPRDLQPGDPIDGTHAEDTPSSGEESRRQEA